MSTITQAQALDALSALSHPTRLEVYRLLIRNSPDGLPAGAIARALDVRQNTLSSNLALLSNAGLIHGEREGRVIRYSASIPHMQALIGFLVEDCCGQDPCTCGPLLDGLFCEESQC